MKYVLKEDLRLSFDGINVEDYKAGEPYEPRNNHERRVFEDLKRKGKASEYYSPSKVEKPKQTKVATPTMEKSAKKPNLKPKKTKKSDK